MTGEINSLPNYTKNEEIVNTITHLIGLIFAVEVLGFFIIANFVRHLSFVHVLPYYFYALSMITVFFVSSAYHSSKFKSKSRAIFRIIDHSDIYIFVFGTYLPLCVYAIGNKQIALATIILQTIFMISGIILNVIPSNSKVLKIISYFIYIVDGWLIIFFYPFNIQMDFIVFLFILIGGIIYSAGAITYAIGKRKKYFHSVFHIFVLIAAVVQFLGIYFLFIK